MYNKFLSQQILRILRNCYIFVTKIIIYNIITFFNISLTENQRISKKKQIHYLSYS